MLAREMQSYVIHLEMDGFVSRSRRIHRCSAYDGIQKSTKVKGFTIAECNEQKSRVKYIRRNHFIDIPRISDNVLPVLGMT